jgi:MoxR-like ATPase
MQLTPAQLITFLTAAIPQRLPILITGAPGVGKSDIVAQAAEMTQSELILSHPAVADPTDAKGLTLA